MLIGRPIDVKSSEITPEPLYVNRREWLATAGAAAGLSAFGPAAQAQDPQPVGKPFGLQPDDKPTPWQDVTTYNNFYEFGTDKSEPARFRPDIDPLDFAHAVRTALRRWMRSSSLSMPSASRFRTT